MAISLGRTIGSPLFLFLQVVNMSSAFFFLLGVVQALIEVRYPSLRVLVNGTQTLSSEQLVSDSCVHVPLRSLFHQPVRVETKANLDTAVALVSGSHLQFFAVHVLTAAAMSPFLAVLVGRRKLVPDFVATLYALYFIMTNLMTWRLYGGGLYWWGAVFCAAAVLYGATWAICRHRELQDISLGPTTPQPQPMAPERNASPIPECDTDHRAALQRRDNAGRLPDAESGTVAIEVSTRPLKSKFS